MNATARDRLSAPAPRSLPVETPGIAEPIFSPSFDSTGSVMFFHVGRNSRARLVEGRLDNEEQLVEVKTFADDGSRNYHARLSPDGHYVAFDSDRDGERGVYIARRDGSSARKVSGSGFAAAPTWSPDGARLAFVRGEPSRPGVWNLWVLDVVSGELERVTSYARGQLWSASWFPDGTRVCYSHEESLYVVDLNTHARQRFDAPVRGRMVRTPAVSPEGRRIVFQVYGDGVWMLELDTGSMRRILDDATAEEFTWDSRGARVAYHSRRDGHWRIWITAPPLPSEPTP
jgi:Tol biopolymer transport system component